MFLIIPGMQSQSNSDKRVGATLRALRESQGIGVDDFANRLHISRPYLANIEAGRKRLTPVLLARAAHLLGVPQLAIRAPESESVSA